MVIRTWLLATRSVAGLPQQCATKRQPPRIGYTRRHPSESLRSFRRWCRVLAMIGR